MRAILVIALSVTLSACGKDKPSNDVGGATSAVSIPADCVFSHTASHVFGEWGSLTADHYDCALVDKMTCALYVPSEIEKSELLCEVTNTADQASVPVGSSHEGNGTRTFLSGVGGAVSTHYMGNYHGLECYFYDGAVYQDVVCQAIIE